VNISDLGPLQSDAKVDADKMVVAALT